MYTIGDSIGYADTDSDMYSFDANDPSYDLNTTYEEYYENAMRIPLEIMAERNHMVFGFMKVLYNKGKELGYWQLADKVLCDKLDQMGEMDEFDEMDGFDEMLKQNRIYMERYEGFEPYVSRFISRYGQDNNIGQECIAQDLFHRYRGGNSFIIQENEFQDLGVEIVDPAIEDTMG